VTSGGIYYPDVDSPFDLERERREPAWGDPTYRRIPIDIQQADVGVSYLHINTKDILEDFNILLPIQRFQELVAEGLVGGLGDNAYSFMGYQGFPPDTTAWKQVYAPKVADRFKAEGVNCVFLTPA
jgi:D-proline reductase (dithiol) PrdB